MKKNVLGDDEYLERLEGKIRNWWFFYVEMFWNNSVGGEVLSLMDCKIYHSKFITMPCWNVWSFFSCGFQNCFSAFLLEGGIWEFQGF